MEVVATGFGFAEGPVARRSGGVSLVSMDGGTVLHVDRRRTLQLARLGGGPNGMAEGGDGTLFVAQSGRGLDGRRTADGVGAGVDVIGPDGATCWIRPGMESPNDLCMGPDGLLYVTDPARPIGARRGRVWRCDVGRGTAEPVLDVAWYPNGIAFDAADRLHVANTDDATIVRVELEGPQAGTVTTVAELPRGRPDGIAFDRAGMLLVATVHLDRSPGEIHVVDEEGSVSESRPIGAGSLVTNVCVDELGVAHATVADAGCLVRFQWAAPGLPLHPFRA